MIELAEDIIATDDGLGIYLPELDAVVIADLHIGFELSFLNEGTYFPVDQYHIIKENIIKLIKKFKPDSLIINGDFKHEFSKASHQEWYELKDLIKILNRFNVKLEIIRGNHDNYLKTILSTQGNNIIEPYSIKSRYIFTHGHLSLQDIPINKISDINWMILAHEHPAIILFDEIRGKHKFRCFLLGQWKKYRVLVLPAFSPFASGSVMNNSEPPSIQSAILKDINAYNFAPVVVDQNEVIKFPKLSDLARISSQ